MDPTLDSILHWSIPSTFRSPQFIEKLNELGFLKSRFVRYLVGVDLSQLVQKTTDYALNHLVTVETIDNEKLNHLKGQFNELLSKKWKINPQEIETKWRGIEEKIYQIRDSSSINLDDKDFWEKIEKSDKKVLFISDFKERISRQILTKLKAQGISTEDLKTSFSLIFETANKEEKKLELNGWRWHFLCLESNYFNTIKSGPSFKENKERCIKLLDGMSQEEFNLLFNALLNEKPIQEDDLFSLFSLSSYFDCPNLTASCQNQLESYLKEDKTCELITELLASNEPVLHDICQKYLANHIRDAEGDLARLFSIMEQCQKYNIIIDPTTYSVVSSDQAKDKAQDWVESYLIHLIKTTIKNCRYVNLSKLDLIVHECQNRNIVINDLDLSDTGIDDELLKTLASLNVKNLKLENCFNITDRGIAYLAKPETLSSLNLNKCTISGEGLANFKNLKELHLNACPKITDQSCRYLKELENLEVLSLGGGWFGQVFTDEACEHIQHLKNLRHLTLIDCDLKNDGFRHLSTLENLEYVKLSGSLTKEVWQQLPELIHLKTLELNSSPPEGIFPDLSTLENLESMKLYGCHLEDQGLAQLATLKSLRYLNLENSCWNLTDQGLAQLATLKNLEHLDLSTYSKPIGEGLASLTNLKTLLLKCSFKSAEAEEFIHLSKLTNLEYLKISGPFSSRKHLLLLNTEALDPLKALTHLEHLELNLHIPDQGLKFLSKLTNLKHLKLRGEKFTDACLPYISPLENLNVLDVKDCPSIKDKEISLRKDTSFH